MIKQSSKIAHEAYLDRVSSRRAKAFLERLANLDDRDQSLARFAKAFEKILAGYVGQNVPIGIPAPGLLADVRIVKLSMLCHFAQRIWQCRSIREMEYATYRLRDFVLFATPDSVLEGRIQSGVNRPEILIPDKWLPPPHPIEQVAKYLLRRLHLVRRCENSDCHAPNFIAGRRDQKYCTAKCAAPAKREAKRRWWAKHGAARRAARTGRNK